MEIKGETQGLKKRGHAIHNCGCWGSENLRSFTKNLRLHAGISEEENQSSSLGSTATGSNGVDGSITEPKENEG
tara:strand:+ start:658 stop:879 length:222 start_codon:yes stop_codon:yes gene_type:complete